jgi:hypothetical protein
MKRILLSTVLACAFSSASAENLQIDPKNLAMDVVSDYVKNLNIALPKIVDIPVPEQLELGWKKSQYQFESGAVLNFKTRDPLGQINVTHGNQNYQITQDSLTWSFKKVLNKKKFGQPDLQKLID